MPLIMIYGNVAIRFHPNAHYYVAMANWIMMVQNHKLNNVMMVTLLMEMDVIRLVQLNLIGCAVQFHCR